MAYRQGYRPGDQTQYAQQRQQVQQSPPRRTAPKAKKRGIGPVAILFLLLLVAGAVTLGVMGFMVYEEVGGVERLNTFYPGVYVDGVELYGASPQEAYDFLLAQASSDFQGWAIQMHYGDKSWTIDTQTLGIENAMDTAVKDAVNKAFYVGRGGSNIIERYTEITALKTEPYYGYTASIDKNTSTIDSMISEIAEAVYEPPTNASRAFDPNRNGNSMVITEQVNGKQLDAPALKAQIISMITSMQPGSIQIQPQPIVPAVTADQV